MDPSEVGGGAQAEHVWALLLACAKGFRDAAGPVALGLTQGRVEAVPADSPHALVALDPARGWREVAALPEPLRGLMRLYLPLCGARAARPLAVGHLGQSLDGCVATASGDSMFVSDPQNIVHLHRMRALCDAVVVGGATVREDDPRLTARHAAGRSPLRVVIDPRLELPPQAGVFRDGAAPTLVVCTRAALSGRGGGALPAEALAVDEDACGRPHLGQVLAGLRDRGCHAVFVEGGGITVSRFLEARLLDRLQIAVAPLIIGDGRRGIRLPPRDALGECLRPAHRVFRMGADLLFDLDLRADPPGTDAVPSLPSLVP